MVSIIGAGPVGNYLAHALSEQGVSVDVYEEHQKIGAPVACTGILTSYLQDLVKVHPDYVVNTIDCTDVFSPNGESTRIKLKKNYIVHRTLFDAHLGSVAEANGVKFHKGWRFTSLKKKNNYTLSFAHGKKKTDDIVIGADGPGSKVAHSAGMFGERSFVVGHQARVKMKEKIDSNVVEFFLDEGNYIGWLVPEDENIARIGVAVPRQANVAFDSLMKKRPGKILEWQSGAIPVYNPSIPYEKDNVFLVGDAATQVKATTYGGIIPAMHAADALVDRITGKIASYQKGWKKNIGRTLMMHLMIRKVMNRFKKEDYNELIRLCQNNSVRDVIYKYDREYPGKMLLSMFLAKPQFAKFSKCLLRKEIK